ncbi:hypothetical protein DFS34DRAFT_650227 [Phlyctochytrium arcticum]|nr:hypothetical protein DFS34DRAFT_650227 [Phlyctochytrium arcticum]
MLRSITPTLEQGTDESECYVVPSVQLLATKFGGGGIGSAPTSPQRCQQPGQIQSPIYSERKNLTQSAPVTPLKTFKTPLHSNAHIKIPAKVPQAPMEEKPMAGKGIADMIARWHGQDEVIKLESNMPTAAPSAEHLSRISTTPRKVQSAHKKVPKGMRVEIPSANVLPKAADKISQPATPTRNESISPITPSIPYRSRPISAQIVPPSPHTKVLAPTPTEAGKRNREATEQTATVSALFDEFTVENPPTGYLPVQHLREIWEKWARDQGWSMERVSAALRSGELGPGGPNGSISGGLILPGNVKGLVQRGEENGWVGVVGMGSGQLCQENGDAAVRDVKSVPIESRLEPEQFETDQQVVLSVKQAPPAPTPSTTTIAPAHTLPPHLAHTHSHAPQDLLICGVKTLTINQTKVHEIELKCHGCASSFVLRAAHDCGDEEATQGCGQIEDPVKSDTLIQQAARDTAPDTSRIPREPGLEWLRDEHADSDYINIIC